MRGEIIDKPVLSSGAVPCVVPRSFKRSGTKHGHIIMYFVYILKSQKDKTYYTGVTEHLQKRVKEHNAQRAKYSSAKIPYALRWFCAFPTKQKALVFERYLKSHSGIAFRNKRLV